MVDASEAEKTNPTIRLASAERAKNTKPVDTKRKKKAYP